MHEKDGKELKEKLQKLKEAEERRREAEGEAKDGKKVEMQLQKKLQKLQEDLLQVKSSCEDELKEKNSNIIRLNQLLNEQCENDDLKQELKQKE